MWWLGVAITSLMDDSYTCHRMCPPSPHQNRHICWGSGKDQSLLQKIKQGREGNVLWWVDAPSSPCTCMYICISYTMIIPNGLMATDEPNKGPLSGIIFHLGFGICRKKNVTAKMGNSSHSSKNNDENIASVSSSCTNQANICTNYKSGDNTQ